MIVLPFLKLAGDADELADEAVIAEIEAPLRKPITGIAACCPQAALGHPTAPPSATRKSRRFKCPSRCLV